MILTTILGIGTGLAIANFSWAFFIDKDYWNAFKITFFQFGALLCVLISEVL